MFGSSHGASTCPCLILRKALTTRNSATFKLRQAVVHGWSCSPLNLGFLRIKTVRLRVKWESFNDHTVRHRTPRRAGAARSQPDTDNLSAIAECRPELAHNPDRMIRRSPPIRSSCPPTVMLCTSGHRVRQHTSMTSKVNKMRWCSDEVLNQVWATADGASGF